MSSITIFEFEAKEVRVVVRDGEPWWVLPDLCRALDISNPSDVAAKLEDDEKGVEIIDTPGGKQQTTFVNEYGLYEVIFNSRKPQAKRFKNWVKRVILPSIRKTGKYEMPQAAPAFQQPASNKKVRLVQPESYTIKRIAELLGGLPEVRIPGGRIDVLTETEVIEVERFETWRYGLYQVEQYGHHYPSRTKRLHLLVPENKELQAAERELVEKTAASKDVRVTWDYEIPVEGAEEVKTESIQAKAEQVLIAVDTILRLEACLGGTHPELLSRVTDELLHEVFPKSRQASRVLFQSKKPISRTADENLAKVLNFAIKRGKPITASQVLQTFSSLRRVSVETIRGWFLALEAEGKGKTNGKGTRMTFIANKERA